MLMHILRGELGVKEQRRAGFESKYTFLRSSGQHKDSKVQRPWERISEVLGNTLGEGKSTLTPYRKGLRSQSGKDDTFRTEATQGTLLTITQSFSHLCNLRNRTSVNSRKTLLCRKQSTGTNLCQLKEICIYIPNIVLSLKGTV